MWSDSQRGILGYSNIKFYSEKFLFAEKSPKSTYEVQDIYTNENFTTRKDGARQFWQRANFVQPMSSVSPDTPILDPSPPVPLFSWVADLILGRLDSTRYKKLQSNANIIFVCYHSTSNDHGSKPPPHPPPPPPTRTIISISIINYTKLN